MDDERLIENVIDQIKEAQIKLGYAKETMRLYYPALSLSRLLNAGIEDDRELFKALEHDSAFDHTRLGKLTFALHETRIEVSVMPEGVEYVHRNIEASSFLVELIRLFQNVHGCSLDEIRRLFEKYDKEYICDKMPEGMDFDYVLYFKNKKIDKYYYYIKMEMGHTIYHRFTEADYQMLVQ